MLDSKIDVHRGIVKECPLKDHCRAFFEATDLSYTPPSDVCKIYVYTDGGFSPTLEVDHSTWSISVVVADHFGSMYVWF